MLLRTVPIEGPWERYEHDVPTELFGLGAKHDFEWYLEGESTCIVHSVEEILGWLAECRYVSDPELFHEEDYWQHPCTFERLRVGDCEDFALWAWRKLIEMGIEAEFVAGRSRMEQVENNAEQWLRGHAWVQFEIEGSPLLLDPMCEKRDLTVRQLESVRDQYLPEVSVDGTLKRYVYGGYFLLRQGMTEF